MLLAIPDPPTLDIKAAVADWLSVESERGRRIGGLFGRIA